jgi:hypothetical protein
MSTVTAMERSRSIVIKFPRVGFLRRDNDDEGNTIFWLRSEAEGGGLLIDRTQQVMCIFLDPYRLTIPLRCRDVRFEVTLRFLWR